jgi:DNA repair protein RecO (recombination protein O)
MDWRAEGVLLAVRRHGESAAIIEILTEARGRHAGVVPGGGGRRLSPVLQPGNQIDAVWRARLDDQIGTFTVEPVAARAAPLLADAAALAALTAACGLLRRALPEREPHPALYRATCALFDALASVPDWPVLYLHWEVRLLAEIGFGLDLTRCALTGATEGLAFVSPRTGRAVAGAAAGPWADRLLPLPACLAPGGAAGAGAADLAAGLRLTGHFLTRALAPDPDAPPLPEARARLMARLAAGPAAPAAPG